MTQSGRSAMTVIARKARAYFSPANWGRTVVPVNDISELPSGWIDAGWIEGFRRTPGTRIEPVRAGAKGATVAQFSTALEARVEFDFLQWGKLQMALTSGGPQINMLATAQGSPLPLAGGSTSTKLFLAMTDGLLAGDMVAVDVDYTGQTGYLGTGIAGAYVRTTSEAPDDLHYVRRVTFNVARIASVTPTFIELQTPLLCGTPPSNAKVQKVDGFMDREGGDFFSEWSAVFILDGELGSRVSFQYPRLQIAAPTQERNLEIAVPLEAIGLHASLRALPERDPADGEQVLCYRTYAPAPTAAIY